MERNPEGELPRQPIDDQAEQQPFAGGINRPDLPPPRSESPASERAVLHWRERAHQLSLDIDDSSSYQVGNPATEQSSPYAHRQPITLFEDRPDITWLWGIGYPDPRTKENAYYEAERRLYEDWLQTYTNPDYTCIGMSTLPSPIYFDLLHHLDSIVGSSGGQLAGGLDRLTAHFSDSESYIYKFSAQDLAHQQRVDQLVAEDTLYQELKRRFLDPNLTATPGRQLWYSNMGSRLDFMHLKAAFQLRDKTQLKWYSHPKNPDIIEQAMDSNDLDLLKPPLLPHERRFWE